MRLLLILVLVVTAVIVFLIFAESDRIKSEARNNQQHMVSACTNSVDSILQDAINDLRFIRDSSELFQFISYPDPSSHDSVVQLFSSFVDNKKYMQMRFINTRGLELLRVDLVDGKPLEISRLQNKSNRYYFKDSIKLSPGQVYFSAIDFNMEHGQVEIPRRPVIRIATPAYDSNSILWGVLVINLDARELVTLLTRNCTGDARMMLINQEGDILYNSTAQIEGGFVLGLSPTMENSFPNAWHMIQQQHTQFIADNQLWTLNRIEVDMTDPDSLDITEIESKAPLSADNSQLFILSTEPEDSLYYQRINNYVKVASLGAMLLALWLFLTLCLKKRRIR
jgi:hypothetical protein